MPCPCPVKLPAFSISSSGSYTVSNIIGDKIYSKGDEDPVIKDHVFHWLMCIESYRGFRQLYIGPWILLYHDVETCIYRLDCSVIIAFRGTESTDDLYDDLRLSFGRVFPRATRAEAYINALKGLNPWLNITLTGHSLGGAIARVVAEPSGLPSVTFNAAAPPSAPVTSKGVDYHIVFDMISAWQGPDTIRIDKGFRPARASPWSLILPYNWARDVLKGVAPAHGLDCFSNNIQGRIVSSATEDDYIRTWFLSLSIKARSYLLILMLGAGSINYRLPPVGGRTG